MDRVITQPNGVSLHSAEGGGFEPPDACASLVFKTSALVRSATPPPCTLAAVKANPVARKLCFVCRTAIATLALLIGNDAMWVSDYDWPEI